MEQSVVHVKKCSKKYLEKKSETNFKALDDVSFDIYPGEFVGIMGFRSWEDDSIKRRIHT